MLMKILVRALLMAGIWWMLASGADDAWVVGIAAIILGVAASLYLHPQAYSISLLRLPAFLLFFFLQSIKGGAQVAAIALRPHLQLRPEFMEVDLRLPRESERIFLTALMSLLPGTLGVGLHQNRLQLHALDANFPILDEVQRAEIEVARLFRTELQ